jgi:hypothetical protein
MFSFEDFIAALAGDAPAPRRRHALRRAATQSSLPKCEGKNVFDVHGVQIAPGHTVRHIKNDIVMRIVSVLDPEVITAPNYDGFPGSLLEVVDETIPGAGRICGRCAYRDPTGTHGVEGWNGRCCCPESVYHGKVTGCLGGCSKFVPAYFLRLLRRGADPIPIRVERFRAIAEKNPHLATIVAAVEQFIGLAPPEKIEPVIRAPRTRPHRWPKEFLMVKDDRDWIVELSPGELREMYKQGWRVRDRSYDDE